MNPPSPPRILSVADPREEITTRRTIDVVAPSSLSILLPQGVGSCGATKGYAVYLPGGISRDITEVSPLI
jgi:hypothetical protein